MEINIQKSISQIVTFISNVQRGLISEFADGESQTAPLYHNFSQHVLIVGLPLHKP